jgi:hypothetical protein
MKTVTDKEKNRRLSMVPGVKVRMTGAEAKIESLEDKLFTVEHGPQYMGGELVVWLDDYSGAYCCEYLEIVDADRSELKTV